MAKKNKSTAVRDTAGDRALQAFTTAFMIFVLFIVGYPLLYCIGCSFSSATALRLGRVWLWPVGFHFGGYNFVLQYDQVWLGYRNTIFYTATNVVLTMMCQILIAYPLSKRNYQAKNLIQRIMLVAMLTGAGLVPSFLMRVWLGMNNTVWAVILSGLVGISHTFIMRTSFRTSVPADLFDAAKIDGASEFRQLTTIAVPLSKATVSVLILYAVVGMWNSYFTAMIYLSSQPDLWPLQLVLRNLLNSANFDPSTMSTTDLIAYEESGIEVIKYCLIVVATVPMVAMYMICQKYFEKGVMIGAVKG